MVSLFFVGVAMAVAGNTLIACSLTLQKHVHNRAATSGKPVAKSALFWLALVGMIAGEVGNFAAFGFASPTVVSPLGATAVIVNAVLAVFFLREAFFLRSLLGLLLTVGGSVVVVLFSPPSVAKLSVHEFITLVQQPSAIVYLACVAGAILGAARALDAVCRVCVQACVGWQERARAGGGKLPLRHDASPPQR